LIEKKIIETITERFRMLLQQLFLSFDTDEQPVYELSIILPREVELINELNITNTKFNSSECIHHKFAHQSINHPQKLAVILDEQSLTYAETLFYTQQLAVCLIQRYDVQPGNIICQCVDRSIEMVIGILAILNCGCSYCPLSPKDPVSRLFMLIKDTKSNLVLIHSLTQNNFISDAYNICFVNVDQVFVDSHESLSEEQLNSLLTINVHIDSVSYVIFTSGTTGKPKAVSFFVVFTFTFLSRNLSRFSFVFSCFHILLSIKFVTD
jgi:non-ribosomal peptide synthetase component F